MRAVAERELDTPNERSLFTIASPVPVAHIPTGSAVDQRVGALVGRQVVIARSAVQLLVPPEGIAELVVAGASLKDIAPTPPQDPVVSVIAEYEIGPGAAPHLLEPPQDVITSAAGALPGQVHGYRTAPREVREVVACAGCDDVVSRPSAKGVIASAAFYPIATRATSEGVMVPASGKKILALGTVDADERVTPA